MKKRAQYKRTLDPQPLKRSENYPQYRASDYGSKRLERAKEKASLFIRRRYFSDVQEQA